MCPGTDDDDRLTTLERDTPMDLGRPVCAKSTLFMQYAATDVGGRVVGVRGGSMTVSILFVEVRSHAAP